jgi:hypothetical protein
VRLRRALAVLGAALVGAVALGGLAPALAADRAPPHAASPDAGSAALSAEDQEVVQNLELLEHLPESRELDTMLQLSQVQSSEDEDSDGGTP